MWGEVRKYGKWGGRVCVDWLITDVVMQRSKASQFSPIEILPSWCRQDLGLSFQQVWSLREFKFLGIQCKWHWASSQKPPQTSVICGGVIVCNALCKNSRHRVAEQTNACRVAGIKVEVVFLAWCQVYKSFLLVFIPIEHCYNSLPSCSRSNIVAII